MHLPNVGPRAWTAALVLGVVALGLGLAWARERAERSAGEEAARRAQVLALRQVSGGGAAFAAGAADALPAGEAARMLWVMRKTLEDYGAHVHRVAAAHGVDPDTPPPEWLTPAYVAGARAHPRVERYFRGYRAYLGEVRAGVRSVLAARRRARLREAGFGEAFSRAYVAGAEQGFAETSAAQERIFAAAGALAGEALALHEFLVRVDARVHLDSAAGVARFERDAEMARAQALMREVARAGEALERERAAARGRAMAGVDSLAARMR